MSYRTGTQCRCHAGLTLGLSLVGVLLSAFIASAATPADLAVEAQNPATINAIEIDGGYGFNFSTGGADESFSRISYYGQLVQSTGTPFKYAHGIDLLAPAVPTGMGDRNKLSLRFEKGTTTIGGSLLGAEGVQPLTLRGLEKLQLRGTALIAGDPEEGTLQYAVGLESPPMRIPGVAHSQASNWVVFGVNAQRQESDTGTTSISGSGLLTYRSFLGKAFLWRKSADVGKTAEGIANAFLSQASTYAQAQDLAGKVQQIPANQRTQLQQLFLDAVTEAESEATWVTTVRAMASGHADAITDQPTISMYAESSGWYTFSGDPQGRKLKNLLTATVDYWFLPTRDDVFLRVRYENGYDRALPSDRRNHLLVSVALRY